MRLDVELSMILARWASAVVDTDVEEVGTYLLFAFGEEWRIRVRAGVRRSGKDLMESAHPRFARIRRHGRQKRRRVCWAECMDGVEEDSIGLVFEDLYRERRIATIGKRVVGLVHGLRMRIQWTGRLCEYGEGLRKPLRRGMRYRGWAMWAVLRLFAA